MGVVKKENGRRRSPAALGIDAKTKERKRELFKGDAEAMVPPWAAKVGGSATIDLIVGDQGELGVNMISVW